MDKLIMELSQFGNVQVIKEGYVFSLLITGSGLSNMSTVVSINRHISSYCGDRFPIVETFKNEETFFMVVLKPKKEVSNG